MGRSAMESDVLYHNAAIVVSLMLALFPAGCYQSTGQTYYISMADEVDGFDMHDASNDPDPAADQTDLVDVTDGI